MKKFLLTLAASAALVACSQDPIEELTAPVPEVGDDATRLVINALVDRDEQTRVATGDGLRFNFEVGDAIGVYVYNPFFAEKALANIKFNATDVVEGVGVTFEKDATEIWNTDQLFQQQSTTIMGYSAYSATDVTVSGGVEGIEPANADEGTNRNFRLATVQTQRVAGNADENIAEAFAHLADNYVMVAGPTAPKAVDENNYKVDLRFSSIYAIVRFTVVNETGETLTINKVRMEATDNPLTGVFTADLSLDPGFSNTDYALTATAETRDYVEVELKTPAVVADGGTVVLYALINASTVINPVMTVEAAGDKYRYRFTKSVFNNGESISLPRSTRNGLKMRLNADNCELTSGDVQANGKYYRTLADAISAGESEITLAAREEAYDFAAPKGGDLKIMSASADANDVKINISDHGINGTNMTFENITLICSGVEVAGGRGMKHSGAVTFNKCNIKENYWCYSGKNLTTFNECVFTMEKDATAGKQIDYNVNTYGSNTDFNNCRFYNAGRGIHCYSEAGEQYTVNVTGCTFEATEAYKGYTAVVINALLRPCNVNIVNSTANAVFPVNEVTGSNVCGIKSGGGTLGVDCTITIDGKEIIANGVSRDVAGEYYISNGNGLAYASANIFAQHNDKVVNIVEDINMEGIAYTPAIFDFNSRALTINGNGKTISNLTVSGTHAGLIGKGFHRIDINNLTIAYSEFSTTNVTDTYCGAFIAYFEDNAQLESKLVNCKAIRVTYGSAKFVGGLVGGMFGTPDFNITGCLVEGADITSEYTEDNGANYKGHCGGVIGGTYAGVVGGTTIKNSTITVMGPRFGAFAGSALKGTYPLTFLEGNVVDNVTINGEMATAEELVGEYDNSVDSSKITVL